MAGDAFATGIATDIGYTTADRIVVRGHDLANDLLGKVDFVDMILLTHSGRTCTDAERIMLNAMLIAVTDHGFTPSSIAARLTYLGAPEAPQAAVAAGLLGAGSVFLGAMENAAQMLAAGAADIPEDADAETYASAARAMLVVAAKERRMIYGLGHPIHVNGDPRVAALRALAQQQGCHRRHWRLIFALEQARRETGRKPLPVNAAGAIAASVCDLNLPLDLARGLALIGRCAGLIAHLQDERRNPAGGKIWDLVLRQDTRNELPD